MKNLQTQTIKTIIDIKKYIFPTKAKARKDKNTWRSYIINIKKKKENISQNIDNIMYNK